MRVESVVCNEFAFDRNSVIRIIAGFWGFSIYNSRMRTCAWIFKPRIRDLSRCACLKIHALDEKVNRRKNKGITLFLYEE
jgi:hypothetical protein